MPSDYDAIRQENMDDHRGLVERVGSFLATNYSDKTHFIFELLQNAEDVTATRIEFNLYRDRLEVEHNGCDFTNDDVKAICKLVFTTKADDRFKIGKFGIGFMSVYDFTRSPCIHSGDEHFVIENYEEPRKVDDQRCSELGTLFVFPFNHVEKTPDESFSEIKERLRDLGPRTLLFLTNIGEISYTVEGAAGGTYLRATTFHGDSEFATNATLREKHDGDVRRENWLVFKRDVKHLVEDVHDCPPDSNLSVQIAFQCSAENDIDNQIIQRLDSSPLSIFFPTAIETYLGFLVQGPFTPTSTRDTIKEPEEFDMSLAKETGELVVEALRWLRERGRLTVGVLETMPLEFGKFYDSLLKPVYDRVRTAVTDEALIPAYKTGYISGKDAVIAGSRALRDLLNGVQLQRLFETDRQIAWVSDVITDDLTPALYKYLTQSYQIDIDEIGAEQFAGRIEEEFLMNQSDDWIREFYEYASAFDSRSYPYSSPFNILKRKPIIRLENGGHIAPYRNSWDDEPNVYLPTEHDSRFPTVRREVCNSDRSLQFLKKLGLQEPDIVDEVLTRILPKYNGDQDIDEAEHQKDIASIVRAMSVDSQQRKSTLVSALKGTPFLRAENSNGDSDFRTPGDSPGDVIYFCNQTLTMFFEGNPYGWFLLSQYEEYFDDFKQLDILSDLAMKRAPNVSGYVKLQTPYKGSEYYPHKRGLDGFNPGFTIDGLEFALDNPTVERSIYIWNTLLLPRKHGIVGTVESSPVQSFPSHRTSVEKNILSHVGRLVRVSSWLPDGNGNFVEPSKLSLGELPGDFREDTGLAIALGMQPSKASIQDVLSREDIADDVKRRLELSNEFSLEDLELMKSYPDLLDQLRKRRRETVETLDPDEYPSELDGLFDQPDYPVPRPRPDPLNPPDYTDMSPEDRLYADIESEPDPQERYELRIRRIWQPRNPETRKFLEKEYEGCCQICGYTFEQRNRTYYFEAVHLVPRTRAEWADDPRNAICLCANHSAQFQHGELSTPESDIREQIISSQEGQEHSVLIMLCDEPQLVRFSAKHMDEFRELLRDS